MVFLDDLGLSREKCPSKPEIEILRSRTNIEDVVRRLHLDWDIEKILRRSCISGSWILPPRPRSRAIPFPVLDGQRYQVRDADDRLVGEGRFGSPAQGGPDSGCSLTISKAKKVRNSSYVDAAV